MKVIFLPGYSLHNQGEMNEVSEYLVSQGLSVNKIEWEHWLEPDRVWDLRSEVDKVSQKIAESSEEGLILIAKSIGTLVAVNLLKMINKSVLKKVVLMGIPANDLSSDEKASYKEVLLELAEGKVVVMQNELDNHGIAADVVKMLDGVSLQMVIVPGVSDHRYNYPEDIYKLVSDVN